MIKTHCRSALGRTAAERPRAQDREGAGVALEWVKWLVWARKLSWLRVCVNQGSHSCKEQTLHSFETGLCRRKTHYEHAGRLVGRASGWEAGLGRTGAPSFAACPRPALYCSRRPPSLSLHFLCFSRKPQAANSSRICMCSFQETHNLEPRSSWFSLKRQVKRQRSTLLSSASYPRLSITCRHQRMGAHGSGLQRPGKEESRLAEPPGPWSPHGARREAALIKRLPRHPSGFPCELVEGSVPSKVMNGRKTRGQKSPRRSG